jgi:hypothetical protein
MQNLKTCNDKCYISAAAVGVGKTTELKIIVQGSSTAFVAPGLGGGSPGVERLRKCQESGEITKNQESDC